MPAQISLWNNHRQTNIVVQNLNLISDTLTILPSTLVVTTTSGDTLPTDFFLVQNRTIQIQPGNSDIATGDTLLVAYRVIGMDLGKRYFRLDSLSLAASDGVLKPWKPTLKNENQGLIESKELDYDGSFSRGFSVGNRQSLVMNSDFNLQMSGKISDDIEIQAVMSDANIPVQAEGNTYQLNEFDKVFIRLNMKNHMLSAGDLEVKNTPGYFARYHKKIKGISFGNSFATPANSASWKNEMGYAVTKGKFARYQLTVQEGNQGPYKLRGSGNEQYLIVLSGTEKIYYDGVLLKRGRDFDYIIDYNTAELIFSVNRLISRDSRITVEFEYVDLSYSRSIQHFSSRLESEKAGLMFQFYNEMDSKNSSTDTELDSISLSVMQNSGDDAAKLVRSGIVRKNAANTSQDVILYSKKYEASIQDSVLVYASHPDSARYSAYFTDLGEGNGSYAISEKNTVNGRVYNWVGPGKGRYEPVIRLKVPEQKMLLSLGGNYQGIPGMSVTTEMSLSKLDLNRFSSIDREDDLGFAGYIRAEYERTLKQRSPDPGDQEFFKTGIGYEAVSRNFNAINPYREVEFLRNWNLESSAEKTQEHLISSHFALKIKNYSASYQFSSLTKPGIFSGYKHEPAIGLTKGKLFLLLGGDFLQTRGSLEKTSYMKPFFDIRLKSKHSVGFSFKQEKNRFTKTDTDSLGKRSFSFNNYRVFWDLKSKENMLVQFFVNYREDLLPKEDLFIRNHYAVDAGLKGFLSNGDKMRLDYNLNYRQLNISATAVDPTIKSTGTILGNLVHRYTSSRDILVLNSRAEMISGQEPKAEYIFIEVTNPGQGNYIWVDSNGDNIRQKGEFELSPFGDNANYIKIAQYNHSFIRINATSLYHDFQLNMEKLFPEEQTRFITSQLKKISLLGNFRLDQKTKEDSNGAFSIPIYLNPEDSILVGFQAISNVTLHYNKANPVYDVRIESRYHNSTDVQIDGMVKLSGRREKFTVRYSGIKTMDLLLSLNTGNSRYSAELYPSKNHMIRLGELEQELRYRVSRSFALHGKYTYISKKNSIGLLETLSGHKLDVKFSIRNFKQFNINAGMTYSYMKYNGQPGNSIELAMMEGLKNGNNYLWNIQLNRRMGNNVEMNINYFGRKTGELKTVHTGSIQAKARF